jgi:hypothetical protein
MKLNSRFNFKSSKRIGVFCYYTCDVNDRSETRTEKRYERTNIGKRRPTRIVMAAARYVASGSGPLISVGHSVRF